MQLFKRLARCAQGQDLIEYALLIGLLSVVLIVAITGIKAKVGSPYQNVDAAIPAGGDPGNGNPGGNPGGGNPGGGNPGGGNPGGGNPGGGNPGGGNPGGGNPGGGNP